MRYRPLSRLSRGLTLCSIAALSFLSNGCGGGGTEGDAFISIGTATQGGAFYQVGAAIANAMNDAGDEGGWKKVTAESTAGSLENLKRLESNDIHIGMSNSSITYFAVRGEGGFDREYKVKSIMTLFPLIAMFVTRADSGIESIQDLKGKKVVVGPEGAGFRYFVEPILEAHGVKWDEIVVRYASFGQAVGLLQDGTTVDAAFLGGGMKSPAIQNAASNMKIRLVPFDEEARKQLIEKYPSFNAVTVPAGTYDGVDEEYLGLNVGSTQLLMHEDADGDLVKRIVKAIWDKRESIAQSSSAGKSINAKNVARYTGVEFHPAAKEFYQNHDEIEWAGDPPTGKSN